MGLLGPLSILSLGKHFLEKDCEGLEKKEGIQIGIITQRRSQGEKGESRLILNQIDGITSWVVECLAPYHMIRRI